MCDITVGDDVVVVDSAVGVGDKYEDFDIILSVGDCVNMNVGFVVELPHTHGNFDVKI